MSYPYRTPVFVVVVQDGDLAYGQKRSKTYHSAKEAARWAKELDRRGKLHTVYVADVGPLTEDPFLVELLKHAGLDTLDEAESW